MSGRTPCRISDGPQTPEDVVQPRERDEDQEYERWRQREIDRELDEMEKAQWPLTDKA